MNKTGKGGFIDPWGTPNLCFAYSRETQKIYAALNTEYKILVKNLKGEPLSVIEKAHENVRIGRKGVEAMLGKIVTNDTFKWILDSYPDHLVALNEIRPLPNGDLLVRRVSGPKESEMDVFDAEGRYVYALKPPKGVSFDQAVFHNNGFSMIDSTGEFPLYFDYRIKNLPDIFGK
jgi:tricorn protease-like protein